MKVSQFLEKHGVSLDADLAQVQSRTIKVKDKDAEFNADAPFCEGLLDILSAINGIGLGEADRSKTSLGSGFLAIVNSGLDLKARASARQAREMSPSRLRDITGLWLRAVKPEEYKDLEVAILRGEHKAFLDKVIEENKADIEAWYKQVSA